MLSLVAIGNITQADSTFATEEEEFSIYLPATGETFTSEDIADLRKETEEQSTQPEDEAATPFLDPVVIGLCNAGFGDTVVGKVNSGSGRGISLGKIALTCGDSGKGYVHIREQHEDQWQKVLDLYPIGGYWDDFMWFASSQSIRVPDPSLTMPQRGKNQTVCYSTPVQIKNPQGVVVETLHPSVIVSENNKIVITSFPTSNTPHCR